MFELLCAILRGDAAELPNGEARARLYALARSHRVHLLLAWRLHNTRLPSNGGEDKAAALAPEIRVEALVDEIRVRELTRVVEALEKQGTRPVVFKGAALAHTHYAESWLRPRLDADILIDPMKRTETFACLRDLGYSRPAFISGDLVMHQAPFVRTDDTGVEHVLDVHWRIVNPHAIAGVVSSGEMYADSATLLVNGGTLRVPSAIHALMAACVHRAAHHNDDEDLLWLYDIHLLADRLERQEWSHFVELASARAVRAICARGLSLSVDRFRTPVPREVLASLTRETGAGRREPSSVYLKKDLRLVTRLASDLRALGGWAGARLIREHLFPPAEYMQEMYGVRSRALLPAFYLRRILSGASKWVRPHGQVEK